MGQGEPMTEPLRNGLPDQRTRWMRDQRGTWYLGIEDPSVVVGYGKPPTLGVLDLALPDHEQHQPNNHDENEPQHDLPHEKDCAPPAMQYPVGPTGDAPNASIA